MRTPTREALNHLRQFETSHTYTAHLKKAAPHMTQEFLNIAAQMAVLFLISGVGYGAKKLKVISRLFDKQLSNLIVQISLPAMILGAVLNADELPPFSDIVAMLVYSCIYYALTIILACAITALLRIPLGRRGVYRFMLTFSNVGFIGFPVLSAIFGNGVLIYAAVFNLPFNLLVFTIGVLFLMQDAAADTSPDKKLHITWKTFLSPSIVACALTAICVFANIHSVPILGASLETLGSLTTPAAMIIIGSSLANMPVKSLAGTPRLWIASIAKLLVIPLVSWALLNQIITSDYMLAIIVVVSGMPVATNGTMLCYKYGGNIEVMSQGTFISTALSLVTIPMLATFATMI